MVKLQIVSDLHLEFRGDNFKNILKPTGDILCLLGDISAIGIDTDWETYKNFIRYMSPKFKYIFHVPGNHEYYTDNKNITIDKTIQGINLRLFKFEKEIPNLRVLINTTVRMEMDNKKYMFIGSTLWSHILNNHQYVEKNMNDYSYIWYKIPKPRTTSKLINFNQIRKYTVADMTQLHNNSVKYIIKELKSATDEIPILLTHHKPVITKIDTDILSQAYHTDLTKKIIKPPLLLAAHGHTHEGMDTIINGVRIFSNPKGYPSEKTNFKKVHYIEI